MFKISDKTDKFLSNYRYLFWGPLFIGTQCSGAVLCCSALISCVA